jgi:peptidoglycan hydrolase-like protein with peptidoglycan-binding domain
MTVEQTNFLPLQNGDSGEAVTLLQELLMALDPSALAVDGEFGEATEVAVKAFQLKSALDADGIVGASTWAALQVVAAAPEAPATDAPAA